METDAFIRITAGDITRDSDKVHKPNMALWWSERFYGCAIHEVWDKDTGLEFEDDLIATVNDHVIPCSFLDNNNVGAQAIRVNLHCS